MVRRLIMIVFVFIPVHLIAQWEIIHKNKWENFTSMDFVNDTSGFLTTEDGYILYTKDEGWNWEECIKLDSSLNDIQFVNENYGWVRYTSNQWNVNEASVLYRTMDGGNTWAKLDCDIIGFFNIQFINKDIGRALSWKNDRSYFNSTKDGGETWTSLINNLQLDHFYFYSDNIGWASSSENLFKTIDGGETWKYIKHFPHSRGKMMAVNDSTMYLEGDAIFKTTDGGINWVELPINIVNEEIGGIPMGFSSIVDWDFINDTTIVFTASVFHQPGKVFKTEDGFKTICELLQVKSGFPIVSVSDKHHLKIASGSSIILSNDFGKKLNYSILDYGEISNFNFLSPLKGFAISKGAYSDLIYTEDGGYNWKELPYSDSLNWRDLGLSTPRGIIHSLTAHFIDEKYGCVGANNKMFFTESGGSIWTESSIEGTIGEFLTIRDISFYNESNGFAISNDRNLPNSLYRTSDKGQSWELITNVSDLYNIRLITENNLYIIGEDNNSQGVLLKSNDAGNTWDYIITGSSQFTDISQISSNLDFACGLIMTENNQGSFIYRSDNSWNNSQSWEKQYEKNDAFLNSICMIDSLNGFSCGWFYDEYFNTTGYILKTNDGGKNWNDNYSIEGNHFYDIQFIDESIGWVGGSNGLIIKTTNGGLTWVNNERKSVPNNIKLYQNYPNPFNPTTTIKYSIPIDTRNEIRDVRLIIYDILGRKIKTLVSEKQKPGNYEVEFDGSDLTSGIYFYRLHAGNFVDTMEMVLIK